MSLESFDGWLNNANLLLIGIVLFGAMCLAAAVGVLLKISRREAGKDAEGEGGQEGYVVSAVLGLLALLLGFTFSMATDRFDARRALVLEEANAVGTAYLRAQLLDEPHRQRTTDLLLRYTDTRIALAKAQPGSAEQRRLLAVNDAMLTDLWTATVAAFDSIKNIDFSSSYVDSINEVINIDQARKTARLARVPGEVFAALFIYLVTTAGVLGYVMKGGRGHLAAIFLLLLLVLSLMLILDINRPMGGIVTESQRPMEDLRKTLAAQPPAVFDRWRSTPGKP
jgi:hypothetical protein